MSGKPLDLDDVVGVSGDGKEVFLKDVWPSKEEVQYVEEHVVIASMFTELRSRMQVSSRAVVGSAWAPVVIYLFVCLVKSQLSCV